MDKFLGMHFIYTYAKNEGTDNEKVIAQAPYEGMPDDIRSGKLTF